jgi:hypothetical protein
MSTATETIEWCNVELIGSRQKRFPFTICFGPVLGPHQVDIYVSTLHQVQISTWAAAQTFKYSVNI